MHVNTLIRGLQKAIAALDEWLQKIRDAISQHETITNPDDYNLGEVLLSYKEEIRTRSLQESSSDFSGMVVLTGLEPAVSLCSVRFAIVAERRCRLLRSFAHHASASLHPPQAALRLRAPSMCGAHRWDTLIPTPVGQIPKRRSHPCG